MAWALGAGGCHAAVLALWRNLLAITVGSRTLVGFGMKLAGVGVTVALATLHRPDGGAEDVPLHWRPPGRLAHWAGLLLAR